MASGDRIRQIFSYIEDMHIHTFLRYDVEQHSELDLNDGLTCRGHM